MGAEAQCFVGGLVGQRLSRRFGGSSPSGRSSLTTFRPAFRAPLAWPVSKARRGSVPPSERLDDRSPIDDLIIIDRKPDVPWGSKTSSIVISPRIRPPLPMPEKSSPRAACRACCACKQPVEHREGVTSPPARMSVPAAPEPVQLCRRRSPTADRRSYAAILEVVDRQALERRHPPNTPQLLCPRRQLGLRAGHWRAINAGVPGSMTVTSGASAAQLRAVRGPDCRRQLNTDHGAATEF
jgi:hypothetical protein